MVMNNEVRKMWEVVDSLKVATSISVGGTEKDKAEGVGDLANRPGLERGHKLKTSEMRCSRSHLASWLMKQETAFRYGP
jgi:hypothetical protein